MFVRVRTMARRAAWLAATAMGIATGTAIARAQQEQRAPDTEIRRGHAILEKVWDRLQKNYYDPSFHGVNMEAKLKEVSDKIDHAPDANHIMADVADFVAQLNDSHTRFYPPTHSDRVDYGWKMRPFGDSCIISRVKEGSDAEKKGIRAGDMVLKVDGFVTTRATFNFWQYIYEDISPRAAVHLVVRHPDGTPFEADVMSTVIKGKKVAMDYSNAKWVEQWDEEAEAAWRAQRHFTTSIGDSVFVWRMPEFVDEDNHNIDAMIESSKAHQAVILDLRNDGGGSSLTQAHLIGGFLDHKTLIGTFVGRKKSDSLWALPPASGPFRGRLVVLINSMSASSSEMLARVLQLEGRAIIVGDRSMGAVEGSFFFGDFVGFDRIYEFTTQVSGVDVVEPDNTRLEGTGVTPDYIVVPTQADIAAHADPAMAKALEIVGVKRTPEEAGKLFKQKKDRTKTADNL